MLHKLIRRLAACAVVVAVPLATSVVTPTPALADAAECFNIFVGPVTVATICLPTT